jgi:histidinol-phosphate/aromatic aminotransferase/cobyric acid decarboxylase-like protein
MDNEILSEFPNLTVIKSMGIQYGVPGLNLAILASGAKTSVQRINSRLADGTVNSVAEYFMQILEKYKKYYGSSFDAAAAERYRLEQELEAIPNLTSIRGQSNTVTCLIAQEAVKPAALTEKLLQKYGLLLSVCSDRETAIRIAVRTKKDNEYLVSALKQEMNL